MQGKGCVWCRVKRWGRRVAGRGRHHGIEFPEGGVFERRGRVRGDEARAEVLGAFQLVVLEHRRLGDCNLPHKMQTAAQTGQKGTGATTANGSKRDGSHHRQRIKKGREPPPPTDQCTAAPTGQKGRASPPPMESKRCGSHHRQRFKRDGSHRQRAHARSGPPDGSKESAGPRSTGRHPRRRTPTERQFEQSRGHRT